MGLFLSLRPSPTSEIADEGGIGRNVKNLHFLQGEDGFVRFGDASPFRFIGR